MADPAFSTHGARQANGGRAAIDCLTDAAEAVPDVPVLVDSGVRSGSDAVQALALGANGGRDRTRCR
jgi:lactate 2-monooxygenase